jgi:hypothetical protein
MASRIWILLAAALVLASSCRPEQEPAPPTGARGLAVMLRDAIAPCWNDRALQLEPAGAAVAINIQTMPDGRVKSVRPMEPERLAADPAAHAVADAAMAAVIACSPLDLPPASYEDWRDVVLTFRVEGSDAS